MSDADGAAALRLERIERRYGRGETTIEVLDGAELALLAGPVGGADRAVGRRQVDAAASRRPAGDGPTPAKSMSAARATSAMNDDQRTALRRSEIGFVYQFHHLLPDSRRWRTSSCRR